MTLNNHSIVIKGNVSITNALGDNLGNTSMIFNGNRHQTVSSTVGRGYGGLINVVIAKDDSMLSLSGVVTVWGSWTNNYSATRIDAATSEVFMDGYYGTMNIGGIYSTTFYNLTLLGQACTYNFTKDSAAIVTGQLLFQGGGITMTNHSIVIKGNVSITNNTGGNTGTTAFIFNGNKHQTINSTVARGYGGLISVVIAKDDSTLSLSGVISVRNGWTNNYSATRINAGTSEVYMNGNYGTMNIGGLYSTTFYNLTLEGLYCTYNFTIDSAAIVTNLLLLHGSGTFTCNNYSVFVKGDVEMDNTSSALPGTTLFYICGSGSQALTGTNALTLASLVMNKPAGTFTLNKPLTVTGSLTLTGGDIISSSTNLLTLNNGIAVSGAGNNSFVSGPVKKVGNAAFTFPIGKNGVYKPMSISAPTTSTDAFTVEYFDTKNTNTTLDGVLTYTDPCEYWNLAHTTGSNSVNVTLNWSSPCFHIADLGYFKVGYVSGSTWTTAGTCTTTGNTTTGTITSTTARSTWGNITLAKTNPLVVAHAGNDTAVCSGLPATLHGSVTGGTSPFTYSWSPATGLSSSTSAIPTATPTATTTYVLTVTDNLTEYGKDTIVVTVNANPTAHAGRDTLLCYGFSATIGTNPAATGGTSPYTYSWSPLTGLSSSTITQPTANPTITTSYILTATDNNGCLNKDTTIFSVNPMLIANAGTDQILCSGQSAYLGGSGGSGGTMPYKCYWKNELNQSLDTSSFIIIDPDTTSHTYYLTVVDTFGCVSKDTIHVNVNSSLHLNITQNVTINLGDSIALGNSPLITGGTAPFNVQWNDFNGWSSTLQNPYVHPVVSNLYNVIATDSNNCIDNSYEIVIISLSGTDSLNSYSLLSGDSIIIGDTTYTSGKIGYMKALTGPVFSDDSIIHDTTEIRNKLNILTHAINNYFSLPVTANLVSVNNDTLTMGVYRFHHLLTVDSAVILKGDSSSYFIFLADSGIMFKRGSSVLLRGITEKQVIFVSNEDIKTGDSVTLNGSILCNGSFKDDWLLGSFGVAARGGIRIQNVPAKMPPLNLIRYTRLVNGILHSIVDISSNTVPEYAKYEAGISLTKTFSATNPLTNPYNPDIVSVEATFTSPSGKKYTQYGFYYQDFQRVGDSSGDFDSYWKIKSTPYPWRIRFSPNEIGKWSYTVKIIEGNEVTGTNNTMTFNCISSDNHGRLRVSPNNRFLEYEDGTSFFGIGEGLEAFTNGIGTDAQCAANCSTCSYTCSTCIAIPSCPKWCYTYNTLERDKQLITDFGTSGGNYVRVWMEPYSYEIEWETLNNYDGRQNRAHDFDDLVDCAFQNGVFIDLELYNETAFECLENTPEGGDANHGWIPNPYHNSSKLGTNNPTDFFTNISAQNYYKKRLRYIMARWGYSTAIANYSLMNEPNFIGRNCDPQYNYNNNASGITTSFVDDAKYLKTAFDRPHMVSIDYTVKEEDWVKSKLNSNPNVDFSCSHYYSMDENFNYQSAYETNLLFNLFSKPSIISEWGEGGYCGCGLHDGSNSIVHNAIWSGGLSGTFSTNLYFLTDSKYNAVCYGSKSSMSSLYKPFYKFINDETFNDPNNTFVPVGNALSAFNSYSSAYYTTPPSDEPPSPVQCYGFAPVDADQSTNNFTSGINTSDDKYIEVFALQNQTEVIGWVANKQNYWYNLPSRQGGSGGVECPGMVNPWFNTPANANTPDVPAETSQTMTINNLCDGLYNISWYNTYDPDGGILQTSSEYSTDGTLTITIPSLEIPVGHGDDYFNTPSLSNYPDYGFKVQPPVKLTTLGQFNLTTSGQCKLTTPGRFKLTT